MTKIKQAEVARAMLIELLEILDNQGEKNWRRGIKSAITEITDISGGVTITGFESARSIYNTMTAGGRGFSEYFIWTEGEDKRMKANQTLDNLRSSIWNIFNP